MPSSPHEMLHCAHYLPFPHTGKFLCLSEPHSVVLCGGMPVSGLNFLPVGSGISCSANGEAHVHSESTEASEASRSAPHRSTSIYFVSHAPLLFACCKLRSSRRCISVCIAKPIRDACLRSIITCISRSLGPCCTALRHPCIAFYARLSYCLMCLCVVVRHAYNIADADYGAAFEHDGPLIELKPATSKSGSRTRPDIHSYARLRSMA
jgi:hypothetical protein